MRLLPSLLCIHAARGFLIQDSSNTLRQAQVTPSSSSRLFYHFMEPVGGSSSNDGDLSPELQQLDQARQHFEKLVGFSIQKNTSNRNRRILTSAERHTKEREIALLQELAGSNQVVDELVQLWTTEREDAEAAAVLRQLEGGDCSRGLVREEAALRRMCQDYDGAWAEPYSRLSTLLFFKGEFKEAIEMAERAAALKPWHFEVFQTSRLLSQQEIDDEFLVERAKRLADQALPKLHDQSRAEWVAQAIAAAQRQLEDAVVVTALLQREFVELAEDEIWQ